MSFLCVKSLLLMSALLLAVSYCESSVEKLSSCCRAVSPLKINQKIINIIPQRPFGECVPAFIVQTETSLFCVSPTARWARAEVQRIKEEKERMKAATAPPTMSLYTILSSSAAPPTPTPTSAQPSPVSELSAGETSAQPSPVSELSAAETSAQPNLTHGSPLPPTADDEMPSENSI
ncbi:unnamed protein product [Knipowitschia caucasica]|uniref:Chemokine interleukin-8-like domain-containing protein n=1 Tax=Knipowitschia caucasica TaxID=637954 RepID=A0AAV2JJI6_KNICA